MKELYIGEPEKTLPYLKHYFFPPYITLAHMFHAPRGWHLQRRTLKQFQFQYVVEGAAEYSIGSRHYRTEKGDLIFHRPDEPHHIVTYPDQPYVCISIVFHFGQTNVPVHELIPPDMHHFANYHKHPHGNLFSEIVVHYRQPGWGHQLCCQHMLLQILAGLKNTAVEKEKPFAHFHHGSAARLIMLRNFIDGRLREGFTLEELQELTGWSKNHIISEFKKAFHMTPTSYLIWIRLERAKQLALQTGMTVSEIALEVGYSDVHSFGRTFKRKFGMSLSQFCSTLYMDTPDT